ncbi:DNA-packaging protein [Sinorhizobium meliloti]|uniref:DNA-packaging protein n=1 Tax=Rhizobium meliloti TaxID=382 RepID=UPI00299F4314|nr:DNA-packaging protein [Sinorhizobium meliloti]
MSAPLGNQFWKARSSHGRKPIFANPEDLWTACVEYFEWVEANPLHETKAFAFQGVVTKETLPKMRAMTIDGLCLFLDIGIQTWHDYKGRDDFSEVTSRAENVIRSQKFAGAAADLLNANIIARDLGLADKAELTGKDGGPIETKDASENEIARRVAFMLAKGLQTKKPDESE